MTTGHDTCSMCCHGVADRDLTSTVSVCSDACEARWAEQFCSTCGSNIADGDDHATGCQEESATLFDDDADEMAVAS